MTEVRDKPDLLSAWERPLKKRSSPKPEMLRKPDVLRKPEIKTAEETEIRLHQKPTVKKPDVKTGWKHRFLKTGSSRTRPDS